MPGSAGCAPTLPAPNIPNGGGEVSARGLLIGMTCGHRQRSGVAQSTAADTARTARSAYGTDTGRAGHVTAQCPTARQRIESKSGDLNVDGPRAAVARRGTTKPVVQRRCDPVSV